MSGINKKQLKKTVEELPINISIAGLALIFGLAERETAALSEILETGGHNLGKSYDRMANLGNFWDYYDELQNMRKNSARTTLWRLQQRGLIAKKGKKYHITSAGLKIIDFLKNKEKNSKRESWDGKWRMVMFDIPEKKRKERDWLRFQLLAIDYQPIQRSVFMGKRPIEEDVYEDILKKNLYQCVRMITIGEIDDDGIFEKFKNFEE